MYTDRRDPPSHRKGFRSLHYSTPNTTPRLTRGLGTQRGKERRGDTPPDGKGFIFCDPSFDWSVICQSVFISVWGFHPRHKLRRRRLTQTFGGTHRFVGSTPEVWDVVIEGSRVVPGKPTPNILSVQGWDVKFDVVKEKDPNCD